MSTRCDFMSSRPSSNTAKSPQGPAPMMSTSVLIGSLIRRLPHAWSASCVVATPGILLAAGVLSRGTGSGKAPEPGKDGIHADPLGVGCSRVGEAGKEGNRAPRPHNALVHRCLAGDVAG